MIEWYVGFYRPRLRNHLGRVYPMGWFGHCEIWGYTEDDTWLFLDPQGTGTRITVIHRHDDVLDHLNARFALCDTILRMPVGSYKPLILQVIPMTCASVIGAMTGVRAFTPRGLMRKLLANGAEVVHEVSERRSGRSGSEGEGSPVG